VIAVDPKDAGRIARGLEPLHGMVYFVPETEQHLTAAGLTPGRMSYFAGRAAPMGAVGASTVIATFYNFDPDLVAGMIPAAWALADPASLITARFGAVDAALRRLLGNEAVGTPEIAEAAGLVRRATEGCRPEGRPLGAAYLAMDWPDEPHLALWHGLSVLREHRGDGHIAMLLDAELTGIEALISHVAFGKGARKAFAMSSRGYSQEQWDAAVAGLVERGLLDEQESLTGAGTDLRKRLENDTDRLAFGPWAHLGADGAARLRELVEPVVRAVLAAGGLPAGLLPAGSASRPAVG
jgi:hypothetical protein